MSLNIKLLVLVVVVAILGGVGSMLTSKDTATHDVESEEMREEVVDKKPAVVIPDSWLEYRGKVGNYSIRYPVSLKLTEDGEQTIRLTSPEDQPKMSDTNFAYVSVVPKEKLKSVGETYNYSNMQVAKLMSIGVGETINLTDLDGQKEWFEYKRLPDISLGQYVGRGFENQKPWEFPGGTIELYYIVETDDFTYVIGGYTQDKSGLQRSELEMLISSFRVIGT